MSLPRVLLPRPPEWADPRWQQLAACQGVDLDVFYPRREAEKASYDTARRYCGSCLVRGECLRYAMTIELDSQREGMWGGLTPDQRRNLHKRQVRHAREVR